MIYFDNAATTPVNPEILQGFNSLVSKYFANPASAHKLGLETSRIEDMARNQIAGLFHVEKEEVLFTSGATESNNLAIKGTAFRYSGRGKHLITTQVEHPSVLNAFQELEENFGFEVTYLPVSKEGVVEPHVLEEAIREDTILISVMAVNNEVGSINDIEAMGKIIREHPKIIFHVDATQAIGKIEINYGNVDLISLSAHKLHGFKGSGLLIKKKKVDLLPLASGGGQEFGYRSGTNNFPYEVSLAKTLRLAFESQQEDYAHVRELNLRLRELLKDLPVVINSPENASPYILSFSSAKKASVVSEALSLKEIYVSTKSACSSKKKPYSHVIYAMGKSLEEATNAIRVSFAQENTLAQVEEFAATLKNVLESIK